MDLAAAEQLLKSKVVAKTGFRNFPIETLAKLCERHGMVVRATGRKPKGSKKKSDYVAAIVCYRQETEAATQTCTSSPMSVDTQPQDEMMDIQPQDDELTGEGDHQIPVRRGVKRRIAICIYARAKDYDCISEEKITLENNGDLSIGRMQHELGDLQTCQIIDPTNHKPMHLYKPGSIAAGDVACLKVAGDGYLRVVFT
ncbi:hypothetical protein PILCRDRAFT_91437 [Piloderma croceum F 1598]|uniref:Uncharacterized protein n=1 Tax=Piloderma croceum (strain F 1598) TaxID=765440 RepID=A0A0C3FAN5_PILCF|nr:hypothetical protein PILCRDRAFT_91434 [Piloderma croceum F 1598]KIM76806.1 hypothetical protein PILCRDRAFT_91437 [Piloderma croceum F 1598]